MTQSKFHGNSNSKLYLQIKENTQTAGINSFWVHLSFFDYYQIATVK